MMNHVLELLQLADGFPPAGPVGGLKRWPGNLLEIIAAGQDRAAIHRTGCAGHRPGSQLPVRGSRTRQMADWVQQQRALGAWLTVGIPRSGLGAELVAGEHSLADRLCWWPRGIPVGRWIAPVSSRFGRRLDLIPEWFTAFREACDNVSRVGDTVLLTGSGTTTERFLRRFAVRSGCPLLILHTPRGKTSANHWLKRVLRGEFPTGSGDEYYGYLSPKLAETDHPETILRPPDPLIAGPLIDRAVAACADELLVLRLRHRGNLEPLIRARLAIDSPHATKVLLAVGTRLVTPELASELEALGAESWCPAPQRPEPGTSPAARDCCRVRILSEGSVGGEIAVDRPEILTLESLARRVLAGADTSWGFLTHCTRPPNGPWPGESHEEYLDELLFAAQPSSRSALAAMTRILSEQRIRASAKALRGGTPAVCLTAVPLAALNRLRRFQPQRQSWSFESYGICIARDFLATRGARPVIYGDDSDWKKLAAEDRPFFQLQRTRHATRPQDWAQEREWRFLGDLDLSSIPADGALIFMPTLAEAKQVAAASRWPIIVVA